MDATQRRNALWKTIRSARQPVTGAELAVQFSVSRQVIVQDVAVLRAQGADILATPAGYLCPAREVRRPVRVLVCHHHTREEIRTELMLIVNGGGLVRDVIIEHPVYGEITGSLMLSTPAGVEALLERLDRPESAPLSTVTGGVHMHTVEADSESILDQIEERLSQAGILVNTAGGEYDQA